MRRADNRVRGLWRRLVRAYLLACVRDDTVTHGLTVPSGVWVCERCRHVLFEVAALREHVRVAHATP